MKKLFGVESIKLFDAVFFYVFFILLAVNLYNLGYQYFTFTPSKYDSWLLASNSKHLFDYFIGKTGLLWGLSLSIAILFLSYKLFYNDYRIGSFIRIRYSYKGENLINKKKLNLFICTITSFLITYLLGITLLVLLITSNVERFSLHYKHAISSIAEYSAVFLCYTVRSSYLILFIFKLGKSNKAVFSLLVISHFIFFFVPFFPFCTTYTSDLTFEAAFFPSILYTLIFFYANKKLIL